MSIDYYTTIIVTGKVYTEHYTTSLITSKRKERFLTVTSLKVFKSSFRLATSADWYNSGRENNNY